MLTHDLYHGPLFYLAQVGYAGYFSSPSVYVWLTPDQANGRTDQRKIVTAFNDLNGQMLPFEVCIGDLYVVEEV